MSFISYAQNLEDVMLWRALKHVENGFYIDVGANDPHVDSVTKAFYERGWHGINVEPLPSHYADLLKARSRDINILAALGDRQGVIDLWECQIRGWATASTDVAALHEHDGHLGIHHKVQLTTLAAVCKKNDVDTVHFLKIDVEGFEKEVINGMDFSRFRPWILVIEATIPNSQVENHQAWESSVLGASYKFAYSDGLNRFYVAEEHATDLLPKLKYPPNVFDGFKQIVQVEVEAKAQQAEAKAQQAEAKAQQAEAKAQQAEAVSNQYLMQLHAIYNSKSWRITAPVRVAHTTLRTVSGKSLRLVLSNARGLARRVPAFKRSALWVLRRFPRLARLVSRFSATPLSVARMQQMEIRHFEQLSSVRIMQALSQLSASDSDSSVSFLNVSNHVR